MTEGNEILAMVVSFNQNAPQSKVNAVEWTIQNPKPKI